MLPPLNDLYSGHTVFITGGTGFLGKVLIEKILRSLPGVSKIFVLVRPAKGKSGESRWKAIEKALRRNDKAALAAVGERLLQRYPNTYTATKSLAEHLILRDASALPVTIFRPTVVTGIWRDGIVGWADGLQGLMAQLAAMYSGALPRWPKLSINPECTTDCVPVDVVCSMMLAAAAARMSMTRPSSLPLPVFHCGSSDLNPMHSQVLFDSCIRYQPSTPLRLDRHSFDLGGTVEEETARHKLRTEIHGPFIDRMWGTKNKWTRHYQRGKAVFDALSPFMLFWKFETKNMIGLWEMMGKEDRKTFCFDIRLIDWKEYTGDVVNGLFKYLVKPYHVEKPKAERSRL